MKYLGAIDVGGTKTMVGVIGDDARILTKRHFATHTADCFAHFSDCAARFRECLSELGLAVGDLEGIGVNMPGMVDAPTGVLLQASFAGWYDVDVKGYFSRQLGTERIFVENDVNSCAIGELIFGGACDNFVWVTVSTGIGGAIVADRKLLYGFNSCAGELGHVKVEYERPARCSCGQWGCAEAHGSGTGIGNLFASKAAEDPKLQALLSSKNLPADAKTCAMLAREGYAAALETLDAAGKYIGRALSYAANLANPQKIYIGGGVSDSLDLLLPAIREEFARATIKQCASVDIVQTALAYDAALMGAAALTIQSNTAN